MMPLLAGDRWGSGLTLDTGERDDTPGPLRNAVGPGFFRTVGIPLLEGREFTAFDAIGSEPVAIVNEAFARRYFGATRALGRRIGEGGPNGAARHTIVGVTRDNKVAEIREQSTAFWYVPAAQLADLSQATLHVRSTGTPEQAIADIKRAVAEIDRNVPVLEAATMRQQIEDQVLTERLLAVLAGVFAGLAVLLAWIGLYAVMSYITSGRMREIGIRMALGASPLAILRLITTQSALVIASGIAAGAAASWLGARQVRSLLFDLDPADAETMFLAVGVVLVATALAAVLPARRASRVNPAITLR